MRVLTRCVALVIATALTVAPVVFDACVITCGSQAVEGGGDRGGDAACHHGATDDDHAVSGESSCSHDHSQTASSADDVAPAKRLRDGATWAVAPAITSTWITIAQPASDEASSPPPRIFVLPLQTPLRI